MKPSASEGSDAREMGEERRVTLEDRVRRGARLALMASLPLMAAVLIFMLARGEAIPPEMWLAALVWAGWVIFTLRSMGR